MMAAPVKFGVGQSVLRKEDDKLIRGKGNYTDDHAPQASMHALMLRSPHAHAQFTIDASRARAARIDGELRMRVRRAQHQRVHRSLRRVVVGVVTLAADQLVVFLAQDALANAKFNGSSHHLSNCSRDLRSYCSGLRESAK